MALENLIHHPHPAAARRARGGFVRIARALGALAIGLVGLSIVVVCVVLLTPWQPGPAVR